jgi:phosphatidylserine decarboxylase
VLNAQTERPLRYSCDVGVAKGSELGWFEHGSTIILLAPGDFAFCGNVREGALIRAGQPLWRKPIT